LSYKEALWLGLEQLKNKPFLTTNLCIKIVQCIKENNASTRIISCTILSNSKGEIIYTPPSGEKLIREKLANLGKSINEYSIKKLKKNDFVIFFATHKNK
jgi:hypothetical protein